MSAAAVLARAGLATATFLQRKALLKRTSHSSYCPYKGEASCFSIPVGGERSVNAIWSYEAPYDAVAQIRDHVAFYPDRVDEIIIEP